MAQGRGDHDRFPRGAGLGATAAFARDREGTFGTTVSPRANMPTRAAILRARPSGVFMAPVRKASAKRFILLSVAKVFFARGLASIAARRSAGTDEAVVARMGA